MGYTVFRISLNTLPFSQPLKSYTNGKLESADFVNCSVSASGRYLYAVAEDCILYVFDVESGTLEHALKVYAYSNMAWILIYLSTHDIYTLLISAS